MNWPGVIKRSDDAESICVSDQSEWDNDADLHHVECDEFDCVIDLSGSVYPLTKRSDDTVKPQANGNSMSLNEILVLVKANASQKGSCCVSKLYIPTIDDAFKIVKSLSET